MAAKKQTKWVLTTAVSLVIVGLLVAAFWPRALAVDLGTVGRGDLIVTINEEGRTRVHDSYIVSTPVSGRLLRVGVEPGDEVQKDETIVARMLPTNPSFLDARTREQARASRDVVSRRPSGVLRGRTGRYRVTETLPAVLS